MSLWYRLNDDHTVSPCGEIPDKDWRSERRIIGRTPMPNGVHVSTVFLGLDHAMFGGPPVLFETMIFGGEHDEYQERYQTYESAQEGHWRAVLMAMGKNEK